MFNLSSFKISKASTTENNDMTENDFVKKE